jgi:hypothetical protein
MLTSALGLWADAVSDSESGAELGAMLWFDVVAQPTRRSAMLARANTFAVMALSLFRLFLGVAWLAMPI